MLRPNRFSRLPARKLPRGRALYAGVLVSLAVVIAPLRVAAGTTATSPATSASTPHSPTTVSTATASPATATAATVTVYFEHRPPLMGKGPTAEAEPAGLIVDRVRKGLQAATLEVRWQYESAPRQLQALLSTGTLACGIGWYHTAERAKVYRYSRAVFTPMPASLLVSATDKRFDQFTRFEDVLKNRLVRLVRAKPYIVSREVQAFYDRFPDAPVVTFSGEKHADLARMIINRRADYFVSSAEENLFLLSSNPDYGNQLRAVSYPDVPSGQDLYMICSRAVPERWLQQFNDGFARANLPRPPDT